MSGDAAESVAPPETPLGVTLVSTLVVVYGVRWAAIHFIAATRQSGPNAAGHAFLGLLVVMIGLGLWERRWTAWALSVTIFGGILLASVPQAAFTFDVLVAALIVASLFVTQGLYFHRGSENGTNNA